MILIEQVVMMLQPLTFKQMLLMHRFFTAQILERHCETEIF